MRIFKWVVDTREFLGATGGGARPKVKAVVCQLFGYPEKERDWVFREEGIGQSTVLTFATGGSAPSTPPIGSLREIAPPDGFIASGRQYCIRVGWVAEKSLPANGSKRGKVVRLPQRSSAEEEITAILCRGGARVEHMLRSSLRHEKDPKAGIGSLPVLDIEAVVTVEDAKAFGRLVESGVGRLRSYGFGMIIPRAE